MIALDQMTHAHWEPCIGQAFTCEDPAFSLTLAEVVVLGASRIGTERAPFSVRFRCAQPLLIPQRIYRMENAQLGSLEIFIVQVSPSEAEAVFG